MAFQHAQEIPPAQRVAVLPCPSVGQRFKIVGTGKAIQAEQKVLELEANGLRERAWPGKAASQLRGQFVANAFRNAGRVHEAAHEPNRLPLDRDTRQVPGEESLARTNELAARPFFSPVRIGRVV